MTYPPQPDPAQPQQPPGPPSTTGGAGTDAAGFFKALFDLQFNHFVTPKIVKVVYLVGMVLIGLSVLGMLPMAFGMMASDIPGSGLLGLPFLVAIPLIAIIYLAFFRMMLEMYYAVVRLSEDVHHGRGRV